MRAESDTLGTKLLDSDAPYGIHTARGLEAFPTGQARTAGSYPAWIKAILTVKRATALANERSGYLDTERSNLICAAADALQKDFDPNLYPVHFLAGGGCITVHMNVNEVLAHQAETRCSQFHGERYSFIHPSEHVNLHQSTNDVLPTAGHMAALASLESVRVSGAKLLESLDTLAAREGSTPFLARTCLQDAVTINFGDLLAGWRGGIARRLDKLAVLKEDLYAVSLGANMVGKTDDIPGDYASELITCLHEVTGEAKFRQADNLFDALQNADAMLSTAGEIELLARSLMRMARDLRFLSSGPEAGIGEIKLPPVLCGSSTMPGKINPVVPEFVMQLAMQIIGLNTATQMTMEHGELNLNVWTGLVTTNILDMSDLLNSSLIALEKNCLSALELNRSTCERHAQSLSAEIMEAKKRHGYTHVSEVISNHAGDAATIKAVLRRSS